MLMNIVSWIVLGAIAGWLAGMILKTGTGNIVTNVIVGIIGAFLGGFLANMVGLGGAGGFSIMGLVTAVVGAIVLLLILGFVQKNKMVN